MSEELFVQGKEKKEQLTESQEKSIYNELTTKRERPSGVALQEIEAEDTTNTTIETNEQEETVRVYTFEEAMASSTEYFKGDSLAASVWVNK
jgi:hypothetical protein